MPQPLWLLLRRGRGLASSGLGRPGLHDAAGRILTAAACLSLAATTQRGHVSRVANGSIIGSWPPLSMPTAGQFVGQVPRLQDETFESSSRKRASRAPPTLLCNVPIAVNHSLRRSALEFLAMNPTSTAPAAGEVAEQASLPSTGPRSPSQTPRPRASSIVSPTCPGRGPRHGVVHTASATASSSTTLIGYRDAGWMPAAPVGCLQELQPQRNTRHRASLHWQRPPMAGRIWGRLTTWRPPGLQEAFANAGTDRC